MAIIVLPVGIEFDLWANQLWIDLPNQDIPLFQPGDDWREFASQLFTNTNLSNVPYPHEEIYPGNEGWRKWAEEFINNIYL